jgi:hypothetical protein
MNIFAKQKIIYSLPEIRVEVLTLPPDPRAWWVPKGNTPTSVEIVGGEPTKDLIELAQNWGWRYCQRDRKFYYVG